MTEQPYSQFTEDELIIRDKLARSRTLMANERTLLAYLRTALAFLVAGLTFFHFFHTLLHLTIGAAFLIAGVALFVMTPFRYVQIKKGIAEQCAPGRADSGVNKGTCESKGQDS